MKATLKQYRQSPRKVRLIADYIRGKKVNKALSELDFLNKRAAIIVKKLLSSAVAGAKNDFNIEKEDLFIKEVTVNKGPILHRSIPRARGRATPINKRTSHVTIVLEQDKKVDVKAEVKKEAKTVKTAKAEVKVKEEVKTKK